MADQQSAVHNRLGVFRAERGWSRRDVAERLDINYQTVGCIERGDDSPSLEVGLRMAHLFALPVEAIFGLGTDVAPVDRRLPRASPLTGRRGSPSDQRVG